MKLEGNYKGIPVYSDPDCPPNQVFLMNEADFKRMFPKRKDGKRDMRYSVNKLDKVLKEYDKATG